MRPISGWGGGNELGSVANNANPRPVIVYRHSYYPTRIEPGPYLGVTGPPAGNGKDPSNPGYSSGVAVDNATFIESTGRARYAGLGRPIGAMRFVQPYTGPVAILLQKPKMRGMSYQVTNSDVRHRHPGWTYNLPINTSTQIGQAIRRNYMHTGA